MGGSGAGLCSIMEHLQHECIFEENVKNSILMFMSLDSCTGKGVLSEQEHFPSGASGQSSLEYKCA